MKRTSLRLAALAMAKIIICTVILGILWKRMEDQYGG